MLGGLAASAALGVDQWDRVILRCLLANLRTTGRLGFRGRRVDQEDLIARGWRPYYDDEIVHYAPHYEAYLWACFLWAYHQTGFEPFLARAENALGMTMGGLSGPVEVDQRPAAGAGAHPAAPVLAGAGEGHRGASGLATANRGRSTGNAGCLWRHPRSVGHYRPRFL